MGNPAEMSVIESIDNLNGDLENPLDTQRLARNHVLEGLPLKKLHNNEGLVASVLTDFMNGANVGVVERSGGAGFAKKTFERELVGNRFGSEELQCDLTIEHGVPRGINDTHSATAEFLDDLVVRNRQTNHLGTALTRRWESIWGITVSVKEDDEK